MDDRPGVSIWPYVCVVALLLAATIAAPHRWESIAVPPGRRAATRAAAESPKMASRPAQAGAGWFEPVRFQASAPARWRDDPRAPPHQAAIAAPPSPKDSSQQASPPAARSVSSPLPAAPACLSDAAPVRMNPPMDRSAASAPAADRTDAPPSPWPRPAALEKQLQSPPDLHGVQPLAQQVLEQLAALRSLPSLDHPDVEAHLGRLRALGERMRLEAEQTAPSAERTVWRRICYALERRLDVWEQAAEAAREGPAAGEASAAGQGARNGRAMAAALEAAEPLRGEDASVKGWRRFFEWNRLRQLAQADGEPIADRRRTARTVLRRIDSIALSREQRRFIEQPALAPLVEALRRWAAAPVDYADLLRRLEQYESAPSAEAARRLADDRRTLSWSPRAAERELAARLETHYRNANVRMAVSERFINRMLPAAKEMEAPVLEWILGARVTGQSKTAARLMVELHPDPSRWRVGLVARGEVASNTASSKGPVTFYSEGLSHFRAVKEVVFDGGGVHGKRTEADADADETLTGLTTQFDGVPLLGLLVRAIALQQHDSRLDDARWEIEGKLESRVSDRLDDEVRQRLAEATRTLETRLLQPIEDLKLAPRIVQLETTDRRLIARCRLAGDRQLAAHTPRPQAPSDSLLSIQIHQTALNNALEQLHLAGKRVELRELYREIAAAFGRPDAEVPEDYPEGVTVQFATEAPVRFQCQGGRAALTLRIAQLRRGRLAGWRDFQVRARYRPVIHGLETRLEREGIVQLSGRRLHLRDQVALRAVFSKVFSRRRPLVLVSPEWAERPLLTGLQVTQFTLDQGWIGVAIGPPQAQRQHWASVRLHLADESFHLSDEDEAR